MILRCRPIFVRLGDQMVFPRLIQLFSSEIHGGRQFPFLLVTSNQNWVRINLRDGSQVREEFASGIPQWACKYMFKLT